MTQSPSNPKNNPFPFGEMYADTHRLTGIFYWFIALILLGLFAGIFIVMSTNSVFAATVMALSMIPVLASLILIRRQKFELAAAFLAIVLITAITVTATDGLGIHNLSVLGYPGILIIASLVTRKRVMLVIILYNILCVAWLVFGELFGAYKPAILTSSVTGDFFSVLILLVLTAVMIRTITDTMFQSSRRLQNELRERKLAEEKYRTIFENAIDGIFQSTPDGRFINVNPAMARMYGYDSSEEMIQSVTDISSQIYVDKSDRVELRRRLDRGEKVHEFEMRDYRKDGSTFWTSMNVQAIHDADGKVLYYEGTIEDITERRIAEAEREKLIAELADKSAESETLRESLASIVGTFEFDEIIQRILDQIGRVIPYDSASVWKFEDSVQKLITSRNLPLGYMSRKMELKVNPINSAYKIYTGELPFILSNNVQEELLDFKEPPDDIIDSWLAIPLKTRGKIIGLICIDGHKKNQFHEHHAELAVTFANQLAIALENASLFSDLQSELAARKELIAELEAKNRELEQFTYTVSHDLKAPIITVKGFLGFLEQDVKEGKQEHIHDDVQRINEAVDKMHLLLTELLELSRIGRMMNAPEKILFEELAKDALELTHGRLTERGITIILEPNLPAVHGDRPRLTEVLQNLIDNAAKFMGDQPDPRIEIGQRGEENGKPVFFVKDNGIGIAPEYHEKVFGLFNKLNPKVEGTGIGLALVKRIVEVHGGRSWVESEAGKGSTFYFTLPMSQ